MSKIPTQLPTILAVHGMKAGKYVRSEALFYDYSQVHESQNPEWFCQHGWYWMLNLLCPGVKDETLVQMIEDGERKLFSQGFHLSLVLSSSLNDINPYIILSQLIALSKKSNTYVQDWTPSNENLAESRPVRTEGLRDYFQLTDLYERPSYRHEPTKVHGSTAYQFHDCPLVQVNSSRMATLNRFGLILVLCRLSVWVVLTALKNLRLKLRWMQVCYY
jgi:hypothetical protein